MNGINNKIVFLGESSTGKTSIVNRFATNKFGINESTIGAAFISRDILTENGNTTINIWDTAGQEKYRSLVPNYLKGAKAVVIVFDASNPQSFRPAIQWHDYAANKLDKKISFYLVANKIDLPLEYNASEVTNFCQQNQIPFFQTSAKIDQGIQSLFYRIATDISSQSQSMNGNPSNPILTQKNKSSQDKCC